MCQSVVSSLPVIHAKNSYSRQKTAYCSDIPKLSDTGKRIKAKNVVLSFQMERIAKKFVSDKLCVQQSEIQCIIFFLFLTFFNIYFNQCIYYLVFFKIVQWHKRTSNSCKVHLIVID